MAGKATSKPPAGDATATDLTATLARLDAAESGLKSLTELVEGFRGAISDAVGISLAPINARVDELSETVAKHGETIGAETARLLDGELIPGELVEGPDLRGDLLKAFRQIEAIANHINVRLPS